MRLYRFQNIIFKTCLQRFLSFNDRNGTNRTDNQMLLQNNSAKCDQQLTFLHVAHEKLMLPERASLPNKGLI